jgi:hypothetical protein
MHYNICSTSSLTYECRWTIDISDNIFFCRTWSREKFGEHRGQERRPVMVDASIWPLVGVLVKAQNVSIQSPLMLVRIEALLSTCVDIRKKILQKWKLQPVQISQCHFWNLCCVGHARWRLQWGVWAEACAVVNLFPQEQPMQLLIVFSCWHVPDNADNMSLANCRCHWSTTCQGHPIWWSFNSWLEWTVAVPPHCGWDPLSHCRSLALWSHDVVT